MLGWSTAFLRLVVVLPLALIGVLGAGSSATAAPRQMPTGVYSNPLQIDIPDQFMVEGMVESCADPTILKGRTTGDNYWYVYCTKDPLNGQDRNVDGNLNFRIIPTLRSLDLVNWEYVGAAFDPDDAARPLPTWWEPSAGIFAPEVTYFNDRYYLYYSVTDVKDNVSGAPGCNKEDSIGVATSTSPTGPWTDLGRPVVEPRYNGPGRPFGMRECNFFWTIDADINDAAGKKYIFYGSYYGGIQVRELSADGFTSSPDTAIQITIPNRYEGAEIVFRDNFYYLFVSAANCCNGPLTGYSVFAGRSANLLGPYVDREGVSLLAGRVGGTPVLSMNGNRWVGPGHNSVFQDEQDRYWTVYHAIDRFDPYFDGAPGFTKRPLLMDPVDWIDGWPTVRGGLWASDKPQAAPAAQPGAKSTYKVKTPKLDQPGKLIAPLSDEFNGNTLDPRWSWVRMPASDTFEVGGGAFTFDTQSADLFVDSNNASVLTESAPTGNYVVDTKLRLNLPPEGCCFNFVQAGLVIYGDDDNYVKLSHASIFETRQTEFAKELSPVPANYPRYGNTVVGPPDDWTYLRIVKRTHQGEGHYTAYTSRDGTNWVRGGTWTHNLGNDARIGLISMGGAGFVAEFDYVRVYHLNAGKD